MAIPSTEAASRSGAPLPDLIVDAKTSLCLVCDEESSIRHFLSLILQGAGVDTEEFADGAALRHAIAGKPADLVFIDVALDASDSIESIGALAQAGYRGSVQLMSTRGSAVLDRVRNIGEQAKLTMLPSLKKPFDAASILKIVHALKIGLPPTVAARIGLDEALNNNWLEFWLQPKIDLRYKQLCGAEAAARVRHPQFGAIGPETFMPAASDADRLRLAERGLVSVMRAQRRIAALGLHLPMAMDIDFATLQNLDVAGIVHGEQAAHAPFPGIVFDIREAQVAKQIPLAVEVAEKLKPLRIGLAMDNVGRSHAELVKAPALPFAELKLDPVFVAECGSDKTHVPLCRTVIDFAHQAGIRASACGIAKAADLLALLSLGCDYGQGPLLGQPMVEDRFVSLLRQRAATAVAA